MRKLILNADDFGLALSVNAAVEVAHREGVLTSASLMVAGAASADAVARALRLPTLKVGLHVVVADGPALLPREAIPSLVDARGELSSKLLRAGLRYFFSAECRRQLAAEIRAQFEAFMATGLALDHVNAHNHMHLHPTVLEMILETAEQFGAPPVRAPCEPASAAWRSTRGGLTGRLGNIVGLAPWAALMRRRMQRRGVRCNDYVLGLQDSGVLDEERVMALIEALPQGVGEIYFHPTAWADPEVERAMPGYRGCDEYRALISPRVRERLERLGVERATFGAL